MPESKFEQIPLFPKTEIGRSQSWFSKSLEKLEISELPGWPDAFGEALLQWHKNNKTKPIRVLSLFSGAGGLDIGFHDAGFQIVECNEIEEAFAATLVENSKTNGHLSGTNIVCLDIKKYTPSLKDIDFIIGGPPCQTFSAAGARAAGVNGTDDERGNLFWEYVRILEALQPRGFLFENVYRIVGAQGGKPWNQIQHAFRNVGYKLYWRILDAADYGVPQFRERLIIVGLKDEDYRFPFPSHGPDSSDTHNYYTAGKAIEGLSNENKSAGIGGRHGHLLEDIPPGLNYSFYTEKMGHPKPIFGWRSKFSDYLYKADPDTPVRTIKAQGGQYTGPFHWDNRRFTVEELQRLQTFPANYTIMGNYQKVIHQIGNSVPPQLARVLAISISQQVFNQTLPFQLQLMPDGYPLGFRARKSKLTKVYAQKAAEAISKIPKDLDKQPIEKKGSFFGKLTDDLQLIAEYNSNHGLSSFVIDYSISDGKWTIKLFDNNKNDNIIYEMFIVPRKLEKSPEVESICLKSFSRKEKSILALWKSLEKLVNEVELKDDLVQLFGYYQYKQRYTATIKIYDSSLEKKSFWRIFSRISEGYGVGKLLPIVELSQIYSIQPESLLSELRTLKRLGFEIRNNNTNQQIPNGMILIPYAFPSLNERSLQRFTEL